MKVFKLQPFTSIVLAVVALAAWYGLPSLHLFSWFFALIILVFTATIILIWLAGQTRQVFMGGRSTPLPQQSLDTTNYVEEEDEEEPETKYIPRPKPVGRLSPHRRNHARNPFGNLFGNAPKQVPAPFHAPVAGFQKSEIRGDVRVKVS